MRIPFTKEAFLDVFEQYNQGIWPVQFVLVALGILTVVVILKRLDLAPKISFLILSLLWLWMGVAYHLIFFSTINAAAVVFGGLFVVQAIVFFHFGVLQPVDTAEPATGWRKQAALAILTYALVIYPVLGMVAGHGYPAGPTFGVPCPTTIFTFGILMLLPLRLPWWMILIPLLWALVGASAAISLSMPEDFGLTLSGLVYLFSRLGRQHTVQVN